MIRLTVLSSSCKEFGENLVGGSRARAIASADLDRGAIEEIPNRCEIGGRAHGSCGGPQTLDARACQAGIHRRVMKRSIHRSGEESTQRQSALACLGDAGRAHRMGPAG